MGKTRTEIADEALVALEGHTRAGLHITGSGGKTVIGLRSIDRHYHDTLQVLVAAPKLSIFASWTNDATAFKLDHLVPNITFTSYLSITKHDVSKYDMIILDECHNLTVEHESWLDQFKGIIIGLTGTYPKNKNSDKGRLCIKFCPVVYEYTTDEAIDDQLINDYKIVVHVIDMDTAKTMKMITKQGKTWYTSELASYEYWTSKINDPMTSGKSLQMARIMRMKSMMNFPSKTVYADKLFQSINEKCILFANTQEQAEQLCIYSYHSKNLDSEKNLKLFKEGTIKRLSCVLQISEGINIPDLKEGIILHAYGNERKSAQRIYRLLRLNPTETATIHILCYNNSVDVVWVKEALANLDANKISWIAGMY